MEYGICPLSVVAVRSAADSLAPMMNQLLYGEHFKVLEKRKDWSRIRLAYDNFEGWVSNDQYRTITEADYHHFDGLESLGVSTDLVAYVTVGSHGLLPVVLGSSIQQAPFLEHRYEGEIGTGSVDKSELIRTALLYLNCSQLAGGRTPFGIDASGLTQMVYKINGHRLFREASRQATQGEPLSFIEESEPGDLAFFDDKEGVIDHVGIIMENNYIIHANGKVRIDRIDHTGIFNAERRNYTHQLRVIKKIV